MCVLHRCDNPPCVRPEHLFLGTRADNVIDMIGKRRHSHGERSGNAILTDATVVEARRMWRTGASQASLARRYGVAPNTMRKALTVGWQHVDGGADKNRRGSAQ